MTDYKAIMSYYFGREVSRIKELSTGQIHCAFADGTMTIYSKEQIAQFAEEILFRQDEYNKFMNLAHESCSGFGGVFPNNYLIH